MKSIAVPAEGYKIIRDGLVEIDPQFIRVVPGFNLRYYFDGIEELAVSMFTHGQDTPVILRRQPDGSLDLMAGERRFRAANYINETMVGDGPRFRLQSIIRDVDEETAEEVNKRENEERQNLTVADKAQAAAEFRTKGLTFVQIGQRLGNVSEAQAIDYTKLAELPEKYLAQLRGNPRLKSALIELLRLNGHTRAKALKEFFDLERPTYGAARDIVRRTVEAGGQVTDASTDNHLEGHTEDTTAPLERDWEPGTTDANTNAQSQTDVGETSDDTKANSTLVGDEGNNTPPASIAGRGKRNTEKATPAARFRNAKEIVRLFERLAKVEQAETDGDVFMTRAAALVVKFAQGRYSDKLMVKKWAALGQSVGTGSGGEDSGTGEAAGESTGE